MRIDFTTDKLQENDPLMLEFNQYLRALGINVAYTNYYNTNYVSMYVFSVQDVKEARNIAKLHSQEIIMQFKKLLKKHNRPCDFKKYKWDYYSVSNFYSHEIHCINDLVRRCKEDIISEIKKNVKIQPEYIYCHSAEDKYFEILPGYYVLYSDEDSLNSSISEHNLIKEICHNILSQKDKSGYYSPKYLDIHFYNSEKVNLYGMSRED